MPATRTKEDWRALLQTALTVIDSLKQSGYGTLDFRLGGGTVLMFRFDHRLSRDIDLFVDDAQALGFLTPRLNEVAGRLVKTYTEQANALKLVLPTGDIDIIVAGTVMPRAEPLPVLEFSGRRIGLEPTDEILAKKILYRAEMFKPRDVFDMSAALHLDHSAASRAIRATASVRDVLLRRLARLRSMAHDDLTEDLLMTDRGHTYATGMVENLVSAVERV